MKSLKTDRTPPLYFSLRLSLFNLSLFQQFPTAPLLSAASGKLGAIVGSFGFLYLAQNQDPTKADNGYPAGIEVKTYSLFVLAGCNLLGLCFTFLVPESKGKSLEEMSRENEEEQEEAAAAGAGHNRTVPV